MGQYDLKSMFVAGYVLLVVLLVWGVFMDSDKSTIFTAMAASLAGFFIALGLSKRDIG